MKSSKIFILKGCIVLSYFFSFNEFALGQQRVIVDGDKPGPYEPPRIPRRDDDFGSIEVGGSPVDGSGQDSLAGKQKKQENEGDIRCTNFATDEMKSTTSRSDYNYREMVANQLIANANLKNGPASRILTALFSFYDRVNRKYYFKVTYADGGWEWWAINPAISSASVVPFSNLGIFYGDGKVKPNEDCSKKG